MKSANSPMALFWRYLLAPLLYPILASPMLLLGVIAKPVQMILILVTTGLLYLHWAAGAGFVAIASIYYIYTVLVPPRDGRGYLQWATTYRNAPGGGLASIVFTVGLLVGFLVAEALLPEFQPVLRWFAAVGLAYYGSTVAMGYVVALTTPSLESMLADIEP